MGVQSMGIVLDGGQQPTDNQPTNQPTSLTARSMSDLLSSAVVYVPAVAEGIDACSCDVTFAVRLCTGISVLFGLFFVAPCGRLLIKPHFTRKVSGALGALGSQYLPAFYPAAVSLCVVPRSRSSVLVGVSHQ